MTTGSTFPIVGVGASAGGLEPLQVLLGALPSEPGVGVVIVQHLSPTYPSALSEILSRASSIPVSEVVGETVVEPNRVYVIPPGRDIIIEGGCLKLIPQERTAQHRNIDRFFRSLAEDSGHLAIGVVLSGSASDGTLGLIAIKGEGGVTFAQDEGAQHDSMPRSAIASGCVDFVLPPARIAEEIARISCHPYVTQPKPVEPTDSGQDEKVEQGHAGIANIVRSVKGVDFSDYKSATMQRRIQRRMLLNKIESVADYEEFLKATPKEVENLFQDVLINVTSFFRNAKAFEVLAENVFPRILAAQSGHEPARFWTLGCSTGEEAYSLAMVYTECAEAINSHAPLQMFASDLNATGIERARRGFYPRSIAQDVSPERLSRFFVEEDGGYGICKSIRERVVFSEHNVLADPPFSRQDFVSCRNLLIYLEPVLQQRVMPLLHYALKPDGFLWLGSSESAGSSRALFDIEDAKHKIFRRRPGSFPTAAALSPSRRASLFSASVTGTSDKQHSMLHRDAERILLARYAPPGVVVNAALEIVQFRGETGRYLAPASGLASYELLKMLREGLLVPVRAAIARAESEGLTVREEGARVLTETGFRDLSIEVLPLKAGPGREAGFIVLFEETASREDALSQSEIPDSPSRPAIDGATEQVAQLTQELAATREYLETIIAQQESIHEELQSANEEAQSANEEMQSINEELETSKEEIQSSNEELATVNDELTHRNLELDGLNNDLNNIIASTQLALVIVTRELRLRRFTPMAERILHLNDEDLGRSLADSNLSRTLPDLEPLLREVMDILAPRDREVQDVEGRWHSLRARPYLTHENKIDGVVVMLVDVDALRRSRDYAQSIVANVRGPLLILDGKLRVRSASLAFYEHFKVSPLQTEGQYLYDLGNGQWAIPALRTLLEEVLPQRHEVNDFEVVHTFDNLGLRTLLLNARRLAHLSDVEPLIILSLEDITEREEAAQAVRASEERLRLSQEAARIGSFDWNLRTGVNVWSAQLEALYGLPSGGLPQDREEWHKLIHPEDRTGARNAIERAIRTGELVEEEWRVIWPEGSERWIAARFQTVQDEAGQPIRLVGVNLDITQRKQMEDDLRDRAGALARADRNKDEFLAMLAHELRNPLGGLRNASETLGADGSTREENEEARSIIRRQIENMARMLDDLLDVSRLTEGRVELQKKAVTLKDILTTATNLVHTACVANRQKATLIMPPEAIYLEADATRLEQVFGNLLNNACKYAGEGSHIEVVAGREEATDASGASLPSVRITVRDNGAGIEGELLPHVFDLFRQASRTLDRKHGGLGIGLTLVRRLVELHGGTVEARSEGIGKGAEFIVILPILAGPPVPGQNSPLAVERTTSRRILIVDDNIDSATSLAMLQSHRGHETRTAFNGPDAISTAATFLPEVILLDIGLPGMDGFEVARQLRCQPPMLGTLIIAMSGYGRDNDKEEATRPDSTGISLSPSI